MNEKFLVIGSGSFSGSDFVDLLLENPERQVVGISRGKERSDLFMPYLLNKNVKNYKFLQLDLNHHTAEILDLIESYKPDYIVNFAAQSEVAPSWENPEHWYQTNVIATMRVIHGLRNKKFIKKYLHVSSPEVYGACEGTVLESAPLNPSTPYASSKASVDLCLLPYLKNFSFPLVTVRATNVYGARQQLFKIIPKTFIKIKSGGKIQLHGGGKAVKSYIHIRDISKGELAIALNGRIGELYHLSPDQGVAVRDVVEQICEVMNVKPSDVIENVGERLGQDAAYVIDSTKARKELSWKPTIEIGQGLKEVGDWVQKYWTEIKSQPCEYVHRR